jgi:hypothetical protein
VLVLRDVVEGLDVSDEDVHLPLNGCGVGVLIVVEKHSDHEGGGIDEAGGARNRIILHTDNSSKN